MRRLAAAAFALALSGALIGCATMPKGAVAVGQFEKGKYLGKWYEMARYDFAFERDLDNTSAEYSALKDGRIGVTNRGYNSVKARWDEAKGVARFRGADTVGELEVSFFGPFYAAYNVLSVDGDYRYALVAGGNTKYLWILSREKALPDAVRDKYLAIATSLGYDTGKLVWVKQTN